MQNLINSLNRGTVEYKDNGEVITHAPTATMVRAARTIADLANQAQVNQQIMIQQQARIEQQLQELDNLTKELENAKRLYSIRESAGQPSSVDSPGKDNSTSNQGSTERTPAENSSSSSDQMSNQKGDEDGKTSSSPNADAASNLPDSSSPLDKGGS